MYRVRRSAGRATSAEARRWYVLMWLGWGLAFMTKGPPGLLPLLGDGRCTSACTTARDCGRCSCRRGLVLFVVVGVHVVRWSSSRRNRTGSDISSVTRCTTACSRRRTTATRSGTAPSRCTCRCCSFGTLPWSRAGAGRGRRAARRPGANLRATAAARDARTGCCWCTGCWCRSRCSSWRGRACTCTCCRCSCRSRSSWRGRLPVGRRSRAGACAWIAGAAAVVFVAFKGALAYWPYDRDARELAVAARAAASIRTTIERDRVRRHAAVLRPQHVPRPPHRGHRDRRATASTIRGSSAHQDVCGELAERERAVYGMKRQHARALPGGRCDAAARQPRRSARSTPTETSIEFFLRCRPATPPPTGIRG